MNALSGKTGSLRLSRLLALFVLMSGIPLDRTRLAGLACARAGSRARRYNVRATGWRTPLEC